MGRIKIRDTTQIDRESGPLHFVLTRRAYGSNHLLAFFRRLRSVLHVSPTAVLSPATTLFEREFHATAFLIAFCSFIKYEIILPQIRARVNSIGRKNIWEAHVGAKNASCFVCKKGRPQGTAFCGYLYLDRACQCRELSFEICFQFGIYCPFVICPVFIRCI